MKECLRFDPQKARVEIVDFIKAQVKRFNKAGVMLGLSGGLDSSTVAFLCVEALGKERVMGLILPERDTTPQNTEDAIKLAEQLEIAHETIDISPILESLGVYRLFPRAVASDRLAMEKALERIRRMTGKETAFSESFSSIYSPRKAGEDVEYVSRMHAFMTAKTRTRMMEIYFHAILKDCLVAGTDDLTELTIGFYDKYGDGACDVSVLSHLYKTQIKKLAEHIGVPWHIVNKKSSHDLWGHNLPNEETIGLPYEKLDGALCMLAEGAPENEIAAMVGISRKIFDSIQDSVRTEQVRRNMPVTLGGMGQDARL